MLIKVIQVNGFQKERLTWITFNTTGTKQIYS